MSNDDIKPKKVVKRPKLRVVGPLLDNIQTYPIFSQPVLPPDLDDARVKDKLEALDLSLGIPNKKDFKNHGRLDAKGKRARREELDNEEEEELKSRGSFFSSHGK
jgi:hypothetical protein